MKPESIPFIIMGIVLVLGITLTMFFAFIKPRFKFFNRCFLCHKQNYGGRYQIEDLKQIEHPGYFPAVFSVPIENFEHPGYNTTYHYYHNTCLQQVLDFPEQHVKYVDTAIQIQDQINRDTLEAQEKIRRARIQIERARAMGAPKDETPKKPQKHTEPKLLDRYALLKGKTE